MMRAKYSKHEEKHNKPIIKQKLWIKLVRYWDYTEMPGQENLKKKKLSREDVFAKRRRTKSNNTQHKNAGGETAANTYSSVQKAWR